MKKGLTLTELLISLSVFTIAIAGIYAVTHTGYFSYSRESTAANLMRARDAMDRLVREIRAASSATITTMSATSDKITFTTPAAAGAQYYLNGDQIVREYPSGTVRVVADHIGLLKFVLNGSLLTIQIRSEKLLSGQTVSFNVKEKVVLRNE